MTTATAPMIDSLEQFIESRPNLHDPSAELATRKERHEQALSRVATMGDRQRDARQRLSEAGSGPEQDKARAEFAALAGEAVVLPDEVATTGGAFARAMHDWASACLDEIEVLISDARGACHEVIDSAVVEVSFDASGGASRLKEPREVQAARIRFDKRERELLKVGKCATEACRPVFPFQPSRVVTDLHLHLLRKQIGTLDDDGTLHGHERWLDRVRSRAEEQLRA